MEHNQVTWKALFVQYASLRILKKIEQNKDKDVIVVETVFNQMWKCNILKSYIRHL